MNNRSFLLLVSTVLIMVALLYSRPEDPFQGDRQLILRGLAGELNDVERVTVIGAGNETIATLERGEHQWTLAERDGYRADVGRIRRNLIALAEARVVEQKTTDPALHSKLGVEDLADPKAAGREFVIEAPSETYRLIVGTTGIRGGMAYARRPDAAQSFLVSADLDPGKETTDWLDRDVIDVDPDRVQRITITHPDGKVLRIEKATPDAPEFTLANLPDGRELQYATILNSMGGLLSDLQLDDVRAIEATGPDDGTTIVTRFETFDGLIVDVRLFETGGERRARIDVSGDGAAEIGAGLDGWAYTLPSFRTDQLTRRFDDVLRPLE